MIPIRAACLPVTPWKNGAGRKADIATGAGWMLGYAWLDGPAAFSDYAGHSRTITLVEGAGFELVGEDGAVVVRVDTIARPAGFDGGLALACRLLDGPCRVLNAMTRDGAWRHCVEIARGPGAMVAGPMPGETVFVVALGEGIEGLGCFDAAMLVAPVALGAASGAIACRIGIVGG